MSATSRPASLTISSAVSLPSKPPRRAWACTIEAELAEAAGGWMLIPEPLGRPLAERIAVSAIDLRLDADAQAYLKSNGEISFAAFRVPRSGRLKIVRWELWTFGTATAGEIWAARELRLSSGGTLSELAQGPLSSPGDMPSAPAVLAQWSAPADTVATLEDYSRIPFRIPAPER